MTDVEDSRGRAHIGVMTTVTEMTLTQQICPNGIKDNETIGKFEATATTCKAAVKPIILDLFGMDVCSSNWLKCCTEKVYKQRLNQ